MKTLVINKRYLNLGGIENVVYNLIKYALSQDYRVVWLAYQPINIFRGFKDIVDKIEIISAKKNISQSKEHLSIKFDENEEVTILSFNPFQHDFALKIKEKNPSVKITPLYIVANTKGDLYFIENYFIWPLKGFVKRKMDTILKEWNDKDYIRYFTHLQREAQEKRYGFKVINPKLNIVPPTVGILPLDIKSLDKRADRFFFNIISVSRFSFPHKNYLLGLVDSYAQLKTVYPQLSLYLIGYGVGESQLRNKINKLPEDIRSNIHLLGPKTASEIDEIMKDMHLNVSVAGSVKCGARNGVVSLPARNFCEEECEVYGYLPKSFNKKTSTEKGLPVISFIEELINMSKEEYIQKCKESYQIYAERDAHPEYLFEQKNQEGVKIQDHHIFFSIFFALKTIVLAYRKLKRFFIKTNKNLDESL